MIGSKVNDILVFMAVVDAGSFVTGGKVFGLSRSTAGKAVARLETGFGVRLFNRTTRSVDVTEEGRRLYQRGQAIRLAIEAAEATISAEAGLPSGKLRITAPDALGRRMVLPTVQRYLDTWPETQVDISFSDRTDNLIEKGFDLAIRIGVSAPDSSFISRIIARDEIVLCAAPVYFEQRDHPERVEQLSLHELLQFSSNGAHQGWQLQDIDGVWSRAPGKVRFRSDSGEALREAALSGLGIALLPRRLVERDIVLGRLERVLSQVACGTVPITALYPHKRFLEPRVRHFIDMLIEDSSPRS